MYCYVFREVKFNKICGLKKGLPKNDIILSITIIINCDCNLQTELFINWFNNSFNGFSKFKILFGNTFCTMCRK